MAASARSVTASVSTVPIHVELYLIGRVAIPGMLRAFLGCSADRLTVAMVGQYETDVANLDGAALGKMYSNVTGLAIGFGLASAIGTFAAQNFGRHKSHENGAVFKNCIAVLGFALIFSCLAVFFASPFLCALGQPYRVAKKTSHFVQVQFLGLPFWWVHNAITTVLDSQSYMWPGVVSDGVSSIVQLVMTYMLLQNGTGYLAAAIARSTGGVVALGISSLAVVLSGRQGTTWRKTTEQQPMREYLKIAVPATVAIWIAWSGEEGLALLAGNLPAAEVKLGAHGILFQILTVIYMTWGAMSTSMTTRVGNLFGEGKVDQIKRTVVLGMCISVTLLTVVCGLVAAHGDTILRVFTTNEAVVSVAERTMPAFVGCLAAYAIGTTLSGVLRAVGKQKLVAIGYSLGYWLFGIPFAAFVGIYLKWDLLGIWWGNCVALAIPAALIVVNVMRADWSQDKALKRGDRQSEQALPNIMLEPLAA